MVELDQSRVAGFENEAKAGEARKKTDFVRTFFQDFFNPEVSFTERVNGFAAVIVGKTISKMYESMDKLGFVSGQEFTVAIREAKVLRAKILLGDRDVNVTLRRLTEALRVTDMNRLGEMQIPELESSMQGITTGEADKINSAVEIIKQRQTMRKLSALLQEGAPEVYNAMLGERDVYMANSLINSGGKRTVGVVGLAHLDGIEKNLIKNGWKRLPCK
ncbi:unnamed protein product [Choristocarpus tenellus]